jgi:hypothetical protein
MFFAVYRQLRAQRAANAFEQLQTLTDQWYSKRSRRLRMRRRASPRKAIAQGVLLQDAASSADQFASACFTPRTTTTGRQA